MIAIKHVSQVFAVGKGERHVALSDISLDLRDGEFISILGPSGCGKSTLLYIVGGFVKQTSGSVEIDGRPVTGPGPDRGPVFQEFALYPWKTVLGNVAYGLRQQGVARAPAEARARELLAMVGLSGYENFYAKQLSGGMKQRVAIARTLAYNPAVRLQNDLLKIWERDRKSVLFVTHSVEEAVYLSDRVVVLTKSPGRIKEIVNIDLPRPRVRAELLLNPRYQQYVIDIEAMIDNQPEQEEAA